MITTHVNTTEMSTIENWNCLNVRLVLVCMRTHMDMH